MNLLDIAIAKKMGGGGGSEPVIESLSVTENGTYTAPSGVDGYSPVTVNVSGGGGASNFVTGTFVVGSEAYAKETVTVPYTGSGYPIALVIYVEGGCNNGNDTTPWHDSTLIYSVGQTIITKGDITTAPTYGSGTENQATVQHLYKSSSSSASSYSSTRSNVSYLYTTSNPSGITSCVVWSSNTTFKYNVSGGSANAYGLLPNTTYRYYAVYSS